MVPFVVCGWPETPQALPLWSLRIQEMPLMQCVSLMEGICVVVVLELSCQMERSAAEPEVLPLRGAGVHETEMTTGVVAHLPGEDPRAGGASAAAEAGLFPETGGGRGPCPGTGTINLQGLSHDQGAAPGLQTENKMSIRHKRELRMNGSTGVAVSSDGFKLGRHGPFCVEFFKQSSILVSLPLLVTVTFEYIEWVCTGVKSRPSCLS